MTITNAAVLFFARCLIGVLCATNFGCGDSVATRQLTLTEIGGVGSGKWGPVEVDTSLLPPGAVEMRGETTDFRGNPTTSIRIFPNEPIKIVIVPTTQPQ